MNDFLHYETINSPEMLENIKRLFANYTLDEAVDYCTDPKDNYVVYNRHGSQYTLYYYNDELAIVYIDPL